MTPIDAVVVAVPARNEERRLDRALAAVAFAATAVRVPVTVVVAADACTDRTAEVAEGHGALVVRTSAARVGGARSAAVAAGVAASGAEPARVWIANTDADSVVPPEWLAVHVSEAQRGAVVLRGTVVPDGRELTAEHLARWLGLHPAGAAHTRVHGANLGVRGDAYLAAGGFPDVAAHEDVALVACLEALGLRSSSTDRAAVTTSARPVGRAPHGFAAFLRREVLSGPVHPA